jgi:hypothetical protein
MGYLQKEKLGLFNILLWVKPRIYLHSRFYKRVDIFIIYFKNSFNTMHSNPPPPPKKKNPTKKQTIKQTNKNNNSPPQEFSEARFDWNKDYPNMK